MEAEFERAVQTLKSSKLGRTGRDALGLLPWYVMIGPSASGKTTAIRNSGIKMPVGKSGKVRGVGGTRNCDWWMTNEAILLDTAGRWSTDEDDRDEWLAFLDVLKRTRPKKPINGILLAVGAPDLTGSPEEIAELALKLRERIDEVIARLDMVVPVYLMVTKCDLLSGFVETFEDLKDRDRGQIWGFTLPVANEHTRLRRGVRPELRRSGRRARAVRRPPHGARSGASRRASASTPSRASSIRCGRASSTWSRTCSGRASTRTRPSCAACTSPAARKRGAPSTASWPAWPRRSASARRCWPPRRPSPRATSSATSFSRWCSPTRPWRSAARAACAGSARSAG